MTVEEFYNEFNLAYNNLASNQAPGLDKYEISVYLTKAQALLVDTLYAEYENSEDCRRKLAPFVVTKKLQPVIISTDNILYPEYTTVFSTVDDLRYIVEEQLKMSNKADKCIKDRYIRVRPCLHDELDTTIKNPFKFNIRRALRLDVSNINNDGQSYIEILTKDKNIDYYQIRYIKNPKPIILDNTINEQIDGLNNITSEGSLPSNTHRQIVEIAAKLAYRDYKL